MPGIAAWRGAHAYENVYHLLLSLHHRGYEVAGVAVLAGGMIKTFGGSGPVWRVLPSPSELAVDSVKLAIGYVGYPAGNSYSRSFQPVLPPKKLVAIAFDGAIYDNAGVAGEALDPPGYPLSTSTIAEMLERFYLDYKSLADAVREFSRTVKGAYSLVALSVKGELLAVRDPHGVKPLSYSVDSGNSVVAIASETSALHDLGLAWSELPASTLLYCSSLEERDCYVEKLPLPANPRPCVFEYVYLMRPDSVFEGVVVHEARKAMGALLAAIDDVEVDVVVPVPDSGRSAAIGYAAAKNARLDEALYRNRLVDRVFMIASQNAREEALHAKFSYIPLTLKGLRVAVVDDSIVRGITSRLVVRLLRNAEAREVHFRSASPPVQHSCPYGVNIPARTELIASRLGVDQVAEYIGADTLLYNTVENIVKAVGRPVCLGCFTGCHLHQACNMPPIDKPRPGRGL